MKRRAEYLRNKADDRNLGMERIATIGTISGTRSTTRPTRESGGPRPGRVAAVAGR